jgi:hypothetical protein
LEALQKMKNWLRKGKIVFTKIATVFLTKQGEDPEGLRFVL